MISKLCALLMLGAAICHALPLEADLSWSQDMMDNVEGDHATLDADALSDDEQQAQEELNQLANRMADDALAGSVRAAGWMKKMIHGVGKGLKKAGQFVGKGLKKVGHFAVKVAKSPITKAIGGVAMAMLKRDANDLSQQYEQAFDHVARRMALTTTAAVATRSPGLTRGSLKNVWRRIKNGALKLYKRVKPALRPIAKAAAAAARKFLSNHAAGSTGASRRSADIDQIVAVNQVIARRSAETIAHETLRQLTAMGDELLQ